MKAVIILHSCSKSINKLSFVSLSIRFRLWKTIAILAFSNVERLAIFKKLANSLSDKEPAPSLPRKIRFESAF